MAKDSEFRCKVFRALHAEAKKKGFDHDALHDMVRERTGHKSMAAATTQQLQDMLRSISGKAMRRAAPLPRKGCDAPGKPKQIVSGEDLNTLGEAFHRRGWSEEQRKNFIRRQLGGREVIRTVQDFHKVFSGVRAMNRRENL